MCAAPETYTPYAKGKCRDSKGKFAKQAMCKKP
jgi:hypothetical protein